MQDIYASVDLYQVLRNSHDSKMITILGEIMIGIPAQILNDGRIGLRAYNVMESFSNDLEQAVLRAVEDLQTCSHKRRQALAWLPEHPVYVYNNFSFYTDEQRWKLVRYYTPILNKHLSVVSMSDHPVSFNFGEGGYNIAVCIDSFRGRKDSTRVPLELFIALLGLKHPEEVLSEE